MKKNLTKKNLLLSLVLSVVMIASMGLAAFAESGVVNLLPYPNGQFNKLVTYNNSKGNTETVSVQGANEKYEPLNFASEKEAMSVKFIGLDGVKASPKNTVTNHNGTLTANNKVSIPGGLDYGPVRVQAKLPNASGWPGSIDLGLGLNPKSETKSGKVTVEFYEEAVDSAHYLGGATVNKVGAKSFKSDINYPSAIDVTYVAAKKINAVLSFKPETGINSYIKRIDFANGKSLENKKDNSKGWYYGVYDSKGNLKQISQSVGAEVMNVNPGDKVIFAYGSWGIIK